MLPKAYRLKRGTLFPKTLNAGKRLCHSPYFLVLGLPRAFQSETPTQVGFIVSKKVSNRATKRNRVKRQLRELARNLLLGQYYEHIQPYISVVFIAKKDIMEASYATLATTLTRCMEAKPIR